MDNEIRITITVREDGFFCNAVRGEDFVCTTIQPTLDMSLASAMDWIREQAASIQPLPQGSTEHIDWERSDIKRDFLTELLESL